MISKLKNLLSKRDKQFLLALLFFSIIISFIEMVGISLIMPFMALATDLDLVHSNDYYQKIYIFFSLTSEVDFVILFGTTLVLFYIGRSLLNLVYFYLLSKFTQGRYHLIAFRLFKIYLGMNYGEFVYKNSSTLTKTIITEVHNLTQLIFSALFMMSELFIILFIYGMMLYIDYQITIFLTIFLLLNAFLMLKVISPRIKKVGEKRAEEQQKFYEVLNRSFGNFKFIKLLGKEEHVLSEFGEASFAYANTNVVNTTLANVPRLFLEAVGFGLIVSIVTYLVWKNNGDIAHLLSIISMFVLSLYRLMPSLNRTMTSYNLMLFYYKSLDIVHNDLQYNNEVLGDKKIVFNKELSMNHLYFNYQNGIEVLHNINFTISKGEKIAFIGESGSGKSTLVDIIMGLYPVDKGEVLIDGVALTSKNLSSWRSRIGYIPQSVYLFDGTVGENIAFGFEYDENRVIDVLKKAKIYDFLSTKELDKTLVGEGGTLLSGGQKQRIAIARALYTNPDILVLDEATSALDDETEREIMEEIYSLSKEKTLIIIAHRLSTLVKCETIYKLQNGKLIEKIREKDK